MRPAARTYDGNNLTDAEIVGLISAGDDGAFSLLMRRYNRPLFRAARSIVKDDSEAEDVLQEAYLLVFRNMGKFRGESTLRTWLTRIVVNEAIARTRKASRRAEIIPLGGEPDRVAEAEEDSMNHSTTEQPEQMALRAEMRRLIEKKVDALPEAFRVVFMLRELEEMTVEETAACLGIPEATVRTRHFRARSMLREALSREIDFGLEDAFSFDGARCDRIVSEVLARLPDSTEGAA